MHAMRAEQFSGYEGLKLVDLPKPVVSDGRVLLRMTAAGVSPLDHTILSGQFPLAKAPLALGNEGAGVVEKGGGTDFPAGSRVMFTGPYGVFEDGAYSEWLAVRKESLCVIPEGIDDVSAARIPVAYLTAQMALTLAGFHAGKTVLAPAIGGSVGNAVTQLARALGAKHAMSSTMNHAKAEQAKALGFNEVIDTPSRSWVTAWVVSRAVTAQTLSSTGSVVKSRARRSERLRRPEASQHWVMRQAARQPSTSQI
jgi:NADPH2:quinone reductase